MAPHVKRSSEVAFVAVFLPRERPGRSPASWCRQAAGRGNCRSCAFKWSKSTGLATKSKAPSSRARCLRSSPAMIVTASPTWRLHAETRSPALVPAFRVLPERRTHAGGCCRGADRRGPVISPMKLRTPLFRTPCRRLRSHCLRADLAFRGMRRPFKPADKRLSLEPKPVSRKSNSSSSLQ